MTKKLVIFGLGSFARIAQEMFQEHTEYEVVAFAIDDKGQQTVTQDGIPILDTETAMLRLPPRDADFFVAVGYSALNSNRAAKVDLLEGMGYRLASFLHPTSTLESHPVLGSNCFILGNNTIQSGVKVSRDVVIWSGNHIGHDTLIEEHCFISSEVVIAGNCVIGAYSFLGINATVADGVRIGASCVLGAGALIVRDTEPNGVYVPESTQRAAVPSSALRFW